MSRILACVDGSSYSDSVCAHGAWLSTRLGLGVELLNVLPDAHAEPSHSDLSGAIGLGAKSDLLDQLTEEDEARGQEVLAAGRRLIIHAQEQLLAAGVTDIVSLKRRGELAETICEIESDVEVIVLGKKGRYSDEHITRAVSNAEQVVRSVHRPILLAPSTFSEPKSFVIALDGGKGAAKALDYIIGSPLLGGLECHLIIVDSDEGGCRKILYAGEEKLKDAGFDVRASVLTGSPDEAICTYVDSNNIGLLAIGAYGHSHLRNLIKGSTTTSLITSCNIPLLLFR